MLALCGHGERIGCSGSSGHASHPSRVSLGVDHLDRMATRHVERVGRGCRVDHGRG